MNEQQQQLLQTMGIQVWKLRESLQSAFALLNKQEQTVGYLLLAKFQPNDKKVQELLIAMVAAIGLHLGAMEAIQNNHVLVLSHHPSELLRNPALKANVWQDLKKFLKKLT